MVTDPELSPFRQSLSRITALIRKETRQIMRDPGSILIGVFMPIMLLLIFGYGISFDIKNLPIAVVAEDNSQKSRDIISGFQLSQYFEVIPATSMEQAETLLRKRSVNGILRIPLNFEKDSFSGKGNIQLIINGTDANTARIAQNYAQGAVSRVLARQQKETGQIKPSIEIESRLWFNETNESTHFLVPGLIVIIMTLTGALLTTLVVAREWERGTFEALFVTPVRTGEILIGKTVPYFVLGMTGLLLSVLGGKILFAVPIRGSLIILIIVSMIYLIVALSLGLVISSLTRSQFLSSLAAILVTYLPALILSGFIFDLRSPPEAVQIISCIFPGRYYVAILQSLFLAGNIWQVILPNVAVLLFMALILSMLAIRLTRKKLK